MFIVTEIEEDVKVQPSDLSLPPLDAVTDIIEQRFIDKVTSLFLPFENPELWPAWLMHLRNLVP